MTNYVNEIQRRRTFAIISHPDAGKTIIVPYHSKDLKKGLEQAILKQAGLK